MANAGTKAAVRSASTTAARTTTAKQAAPAKRPTVKKATAKRTVPIGKAAAKKAATKKAAAKKAAAKKAAAKKAATKRGAPPGIEVDDRSAATRSAADSGEAAGPAASGSTPAPKHAAAPRRMKAWLEIPILLVVAIVVTLIVKALLAQAFYIPSGSMEPQLHINDRVLVSRLSYRLHDPNRGDLIVFPSPIATKDDHGFLGGIVDDVLDALAIGDRGEEELIKRVIGLPGETIEARDGRVLIDGRVLTEPYLPEDVTTADFGPVEIPEGRVFVMGDNRGNSHDSRFSDIGTIAVDDIVGRAIARVWPPGRTAFL